MRINWLALALALPAALAVLIVVVPLFFAGGLASVPLVFLGGALLFLWGILFLALQVLYVAYAMIDAWMKKKGGGERGGRYSLKQSRAVR